MKSKRLIHELLDFSDFIAELTASLTVTKFEEIDRNIVSAQQRICELFGLDRCTLVQLTADGLSLVSTHSWPLEPPEPTLKSSELPYFSGVLVRGEVLTWESLDELPPEAAKDKKWVLDNSGPRSNLTFPLLAAGRVFGALGFSTTTHERCWDESVQSQLRLVAELFANTISRRRMWMELQASAEHTSLAVEAAELGLWSWDTEGKMWATGRTRTLLGFNETESIRYDQFIERLHPEDRDRMRETMEIAKRDGTEFRCDYRIILPDGVIRWLASRGKLCVDRSGRSREMMGVVQDITDRKRDIERLSNALDEVRALKEQLLHENVYLKQEVKASHGASGLIGRSSAIQKVLQLVEQVAPLPSTVLILGETGTGKELVAAAIHDASSRRNRQMIKVNCAAIPAALMESELFGREKGAYTGALSRQPGRFEIANGSTIFLDEVGEMSIELQVKLLRVLQERKFERLGSPKSIDVDVRIIAATNRNLPEEVRAGRFREDLFYRLNVFPIHIPPLRERAEDIPLLINAFVHEFAKAQTKQISGIQRSSLDALLHYSWPGNVRELRNVVERAVIVSAGPRVSLELPASSTAAAHSRAMSLQDVEKEHILHTLKLKGWRIRGVNGAAQALGLKPTTLESRLKKLGIQRHHV